MEHNNYVLNNAKQLENMHWGSSKRFDFQTAKINQLETDHLYYSHKSVYKMSYGHIWKSSYKITHYNIQIQFKLQF